MREEIEVRKRSKQFMGKSSNKTHSAMMENYRYEKNNVIRQICLWHTRTLQNIQIKCLMIWQIKEKLKMLDIYGLIPADWNHMLTFDHL